MVQTLERRDPSGISPADVTAGNNQLGDNAAAAIASLIHSLPELKSLLLAGNILGGLAVYAEDVDGRTWGPREPW